MGGSLTFPMCYQSRRHLKVLRGRIHVSWDGPRNYTRRCVLAQPSCVHAEIPMIDAKNRAFPRPLPSAGGGYWTGARHAA